MPQPRLTKEPSGSSSAARSAICSRVRRCLAKVDTLRQDNAVHINGWRHDGLRIEVADFDNLLHFHDSHFCGRRHDGIEIPASFTIHEISQAVRAVGLDESVVRTQGIFENVSLAADYTLFFTARDFRAHADGRIEGGNSRSIRAHPFAENSLRH